MHLLAWGQMDGTGQDGQELQGFFHALARCSRVQELPPRNGSEASCADRRRESLIVELLVFSLQGRGDELDEAFSQGLVAWEAVWAEPD